MNTMKYLVGVLLLCISCSKIEKPNKKEIIHPTEENFLEKGEVNSLIDTNKTSNLLSKIVVQIQSYENRIQEGRVETNPIELRTYLLDTETGAGHYEGTNLPKIYYLDESYIAVKGKNQNPIVEIYKMARPCCKW